MRSHSMYYESMQGFICCFRLLVFDLRVFNSLRLCVNYNTIICYPVFNKKKYVKACQCCLPITKLTTSKVFPKVVCTRENSTFIIDQRRWGCRI